ncbi:conjugation system SOS inhibitor PsiB [Erwinia mallotivora]|uniref:conjugation system SOS inhibitor PsiB n=1 Tax=Erwinia mallotivora TaxID=69222 RepID=UPI0021BF2EC4|nr:conjugation system SOS inhibitor PsiB [Erwinia mallotivora]
MKNEYNSERLAQMQADEFEACREAGIEYRYGMTRAVMALITLPDTWEMNGERGGEYGGLFPVQVRFAPAHGRFRVALCSPGEISDRWLMVIIPDDGRSVTCVRSRAHFEPATFSATLSLAAVMDEAGYNFSAIRGTLMGDEL